MPRVRNCTAERCFALAKPRAGAAGEPRDGAVRPKAIPVAFLATRLCLIEYKSRKCYPTFTSAEGVTDVGVAQVVRAWDS